MLNLETKSWSGRTFLRLVTVPAMPIGVFVVLFIVFLSFASPNFFTFSNIIAITRQTTILGVVSIGMALSIIAGGMDLSVGAVMALSISIAGTFSSYGWPYISVFAVALLVGAACGLLNGLFVNRLRISPIIVTLGTMNIYRGIAFVYTRGYWVTGLPSSYLRIGAGLVPLVLWLIVLGFSLWMTRQTRFGRHVYAVGGNENSAKLAGVNVRSVKTAVYLICGVLAALGGMIFVGRTGVIQPSAGIGYEMQAIAAAVIGGASIVGGRGTNARHLSGVHPSGSSPERACAAQGLRVLAGCLHGSDHRRRPSAGQLSIRVQGEVEMNQRIRQGLKRFVASHGYELSLLGIMIAWVVVMSILSEDFLTVRNIATAARGMTENCIVAVGMTLVMISGGIDLSVGAVMALCPCAVGLLFGAGWPFYAAVPVGLLLGVLVGAINAAAIVRAKIQPIIITLATMTAVRSVVYGVTLGKSVSSFPPSFGDLGMGTVYGVPFSVIIAFVFIVIGGIILRRTIFGRFIYAVGGNEKAAVASGVNAGAVKWFVYLTCALFASMAGLLFASRLSNATPDAGTSTPLDVISAVLLGGTSIVGGQGRILGTVMGVILMGSMVNGFNLVGINSYWQTIFIGCVLIAVVGFDARRQARFA